MFRLVFVTIFREQSTSGSTDIQRMYMELNFYSVSSNW